MGRGELEDLQVTEINNNFTQKDIVTLKKCIHEALEKKVPFLEILYAQEDINLSTKKIGKLLIDVLRLGENKENFAALLELLESNTANPILAAVPNEFPNTFVSTTKDIRSKAEKALHVNSMPITFTNEEITKYVKRELTDYFNLDLTTPEGKAKLLEFLNYEDGKTWYIGNSSIQTTNQSLFRLFETARGGEALGIPKDRAPNKWEMVAIGYRIIQELYPIREKIEVISTAYMAAFWEIDRNAIAYREVTKLQNVKILHHGNLTNKQKRYIHSLKSNENVFLILKEFFKCTFSVEKEDQISISSNTSLNLHRAYGTVKNLLINSTKLLQLAELELCAELQPETYKLIVLHLNNKASTAKIRRTDVEKVFTEIFQVLCKKLGMTQFPKLTFEK